MPFKQGSFFPFWNVKMVDSWCVATVPIFYGCSLATAFAPKLLLILEKSTAFGPVWSQSLRSTILPSVKGGLVFIVFVLGPMHKIWAVHICFSNDSVTRRCYFSVFNLIDTTVSLQWYTDHTLIPEECSNLQLLITKNALLCPWYLQTSCSPALYALFWHSQTGIFAIIWFLLSVHYKITLWPPILHKWGNLPLNIHSHFFQATNIWFVPCWIWKGRWTIPFRW